MMFMIASISLSILARTAYDSKLNIVAKSSHTAYQKSDANAETIIKNLKDLDDADVRIPENTRVDYSSLGCVSGSDRYCYDADGDLISSSSKLVDSDGQATVYSVKQDASNRDASRAVFVPIPNRVGNYLVDDDSVSGSETPKVALNGSCQAKITYKCGKNDSASLEVRVYAGSSANLSSGSWKKASGLSFDCSGTANTEKTVTVTDSNYDFSNGTTYYFAIKRKSPSSLTLDSNYVLVHGSFTPTGGC